MQNMNNDELLDYAAWRFGLPGANKPASVNAMADLVKCISLKEIFDEVRSRSMTIAQTDRFGAILGHGG